MTARLINRSAQTARRAIIRIRSWLSPSTPHRTSARSFTVDDSSSDACSACVRLATNVPAHSSSVHTSCTTEEIGTLVPCTLAASCATGLVSDEAKFTEGSNSIPGVLVTRPQPPTLSPLTLPADTVNVAYNQTITASGYGTITLTVSNIQNAITGLTVPASGTTTLHVTGTPTVAGTERFTVTATDSLGDTTIVAYSVTVNAPVTLSPLTLPADTINVPTARRSQPAGVRETRR